MKSLIVIVLLLVNVILINAQPPEGNANVGDSYGASITSSDAVELTKVPDLLGDKEAINVKVMAKVIDVCPKKGCWMLLETPDQSKVFVKMKDYGFFVPMNLIGKNVAIDGEAKTIVTSVDELKHYAEDAKKSKEEIASITEPKKEIRITANGILVVK
jgi:hypothetical protein